MPGTIPEISTQGYAPNSARAGEHGLQPMREKAEDLGSGQTAGESHQHAEIVHRQLLPGPRPNPALTRGSIHFRRFAPQLAVVQPLDTLWSPRSLGTLTFRDFKHRVSTVFPGATFLRQVVRARR